MDRRELRLVVPESVRAVPADLALVIGVTLLTVLVTTLPVIRETPLRIVLGLPFVLFLPGYAFVAALFLEAGESPRSDDHSEGRIRDRGIDLIERAALSFGMSIALVPLIGLALDLASQPLSFGPILLSLSSFTVLCTVVAVVRRRRLPPTKRFVVPYRSWLNEGRTTIESSDRRSAVLHVGLALSIVLALSTMTYAIAVPQQGERFTDFHLLTEGEDGELVAAGYPTTFEYNEPQSLYIGIENHERETIEYTVVIQLQRVERADDESTVTERQELDRFRTTVEHGETWQENRSVAPTLLGEDLRLTFLLYTDEPPAEPTRQNAYRSLHIWIDVVEATEDQQTESANESRN